MNLKLRFHKITHWEYWSVYSIYLPLFPVWLYCAYKAKTLLFFHGANPSIKYGGMAMESKKEIYDLIPKNWIPKTIFISLENHFKEILRQLKSQEIKFPVIVKPDIGLKGLGVVEIKNLTELEHYYKNNNYDFLIQEKINYQNEVGIFYHRFPDENKGKITGMGETLTTIQTLTKSLEDKITGMGTAEEITLTKSEMGKLKDNFLKFQEDTEKAFEKMQKVKNVMPAEYEKEFILSHFRKSLTESFIKINENPGMVVDFGDTFLKGEATGDFPTSITEFEYWNTVWLAIQASNPILQDINILPIEGAKLEIPIELVGLPAVAWADELDTRNNTSGLNLGTIEVNINELYAYPKLTRTLLATERVAIQSLLAGRVEEALAFAIAEAILKGDGTKKPLGILKTQKVLDNALEMNINNITGDDLIDIYFKQEDNEIANSKWYMHKSWFAHILKLKNSQGDYLAFNSVIGGMLTPVLLGRPVTFVKTMPAFDKTASTYTDGDVPILFGSLKNGTLAIRNNKLQTSFQNGITDPRYIQFYTLTNVGSKVARPEFFHAIKHKGA